MRVWLVTVALLSAACGYMPMASNGVVPATVTRLYVSVDEGTAGDPELADAVARALRQVIRRDGRFALTNSEPSADAVLRVGLELPVTRPVAFDEFDDPLDYETTLIARARLDVPDRAPLWEAREVAVTRAHGAVAGAVVTSSSAFVAGERIRPEDLAAFDTVQLGQERISHAQAALVHDLAQTIYLRLVEGR